MANLKDLIYLSNEDYETLVSSGTVTLQGDTLTYDDTNLYVTPDKVATQTEDGLMSSTDKLKLDNDVVTKTYYAVNSSNGGIVKVNATLGVGINSDHELKLEKATTTEINNQSSVNKVIMPDQIRLATKVGLINGNSDNLWSAAEKQAARELIGADAVVSASSTNGNILINNTETQVYDDTAVYSAIALKEDAANKTTTLSSTPGNTKFPTEKLVYDLLPKVIR